MKRVGFGILIAIFSLFASACSPLASSVSKFSNTSSHKAISADSSSLINESTSSKTLKFSSNDEAEDSSANTVVYTHARFKKVWSLIQSMRPSFELSVRDFDGFMKKGEVSFKVNDRKIKDNEAFLSSKQTRIYLVIDADPATIKRERLGEIKIRLNWNKTNNDGMWTLLIEEPNMQTGDPIKDADAENIRNSLRNHLIGVAVEFRTDIASAH